MSSKTPLIAVITNVSFSFEQPPTDHNGDLGALEFSDLVALKKKLPNTSQFVPLFTSN